MLGFFLVLRREMCVNRERETDRERERQTERERDDIHMKTMHCCYIVGFVLGE